MALAAGSKVVIVASGVATPLMWSAGRAAVLWLESRWKGSQTLLGSHMAKTGQVYHRRARFFIIT
jgi:hypothetical protein